MQSFVDNIASFVYSLCMSVADAFYKINEIWYNNYLSFLDKKIIDGTLINVGLTWRELLYFVSVWVITILFIIFIFKLVMGVVRFFFIGR